MINFNKNNILTLMSILVLILGFQNCGESSFQNIEGVQNTPASSLITNDTKYKRGMDFAVMSMSSGSSALDVEFKVSKNEDDALKILDDSTDYTCTFEDANSSEDLLQISEITTISHPATITSAFDVCDSSGGNDIYYAIGDQSKIYLIFKDETEDCYTGNPQKLLDQNKRVFIVDNLFINDVENLIESAQQDVLNNSKCSSFNSAQD